MNTTALSSTRRTRRWPLARALCLMIPIMLWSHACQASPSPDLTQLLRPMPLGPVGAGTSPPSPGEALRPTTAMSAAQLAADSSAQAQSMGRTDPDTTVKVYDVRHMRASDLQALVWDPAAPLLSRERCSVVVEPRSNTLLVKGAAADQQLIENLIRRLDTPSQQVLLEVKIISADEFFGQSLGARFGITSSHMLNPASPRSSGVQVGSTVGELNQIANNGTSSFPSGVALPASNTLTSAPVSTFALGFYKLPAGINIGLEISALEEAGHTQVLSNPRLVVSNQRPGLISSGQRIPYSKPSLVQGVNTTEFVDVKVSVAVMALVAPDGTITMDLTLNDDSVGASSTVGPTINTNQATSNVTIRSGETLVLGGFHSSSQGLERNRTPLLADVPVVGALFRNRSETTIKRELLFIITPTIIDEVH